MPDYEKVFPRNESHSFDAEAFDEGVRSQGVRLIHYQAMRCPVGLIDMYDSRRPHDDHAQCSNGFLYKEAGTVTALFTGNSTSTRAVDMGLLDGSSVQVTLPRTYDGSDQQIYVATYDRFYLAEAGDVTVVNWQLFEAHASGMDRFKYPIVAVEHIIDSDGKEYGPKDYDLRDGVIYWKPGKGPGRNPKMPDRGTVGTVRYRYRPYWYAKQLIHEVRVTQITDMLGNRSIQRMPYSVHLQREYLFENEDNDQSVTQKATPSVNDLRQVSGPSSGSFGPR